MSLRQYENQAEHGMDIQQFDIKGSSDPFLFCRLSPIMPRQSYAQIQKYSRFHGQGDCHLFTISSRMPKSKSPAIFTIRVIGLTISN